MGRAIPGSPSTSPVPPAFMEPSPLWRDKKNRRITCQRQCLSSSYLSLDENGWFWEAGALTEPLRPQNADITSHAINARLVFLGRRTRLSPPAPWCEPRHLFSIQIQPPPTAAWPCPNQPWGDVVEKIPSPAIGRIISHKYIFIVYLMPFILKYENFRNAAISLNKYPDA